MHPVKDLREHSSDTVGGTPIDVALWETKRLWPKDQHADFEYSPYPLYMLVRALHDGGTLVLGGNYQNLPPHYRRWTNNDNFAHALAVRALSEDSTPLSTFLYDPLGGGSTLQPYDGEWISINAILNEFTWKNRFGNIWAGIVANRRAPTMKKLHLYPPAKTDREVRLEVGTNGYQSTSILSPSIKQFNNSDKWRQTLGLLEGGWYAVLLYVGEDRPYSVVYVRKEGVLQMRETEKTKVDTDALVLANRALQTMNENLNEKIDSAVNTLQR
jgi:hypothetical protein